MVNPIRVVNVSKISREEWLEFRREGIGGSDAAVVLGLNPFRSLLELYSDKLGLLPDKEDTELMRTGRDLEQYVASRFCEATGKRVKKNNFMYRSSEYPCMIADVDREIVGENAGLECKTTNAYNKTDFENGEVPLTYYVQCMHYMAVMGYDRMYLAVLILGRGFYWFTVERSETEIAALEKAENDFWEQHVQKEVPPPPDGSASARTAIEALAGGGSTEDIPIYIHTHDNDLEEYQQLSAEKKQIDKRMEEIRQSIQIDMMESTVGFSEKYRVTWKPQKRVDIDRKMLKEKYPKIYEEVCKTSETRIFRIKEEKANAENNEY